VKFYSLTQIVNALADNNLRFHNRQRFILSYVIQSDVKEVDTLAQLPWQSEGKQSIHVKETN
jgi:hypothetical protein